jgi:hypothetical protein
MNLKTIPFLFVLVFWLVSSGAIPADLCARDADITCSVTRGLYRG